MNVLIIGAAGKTGSLVVERSLAAGHHVTAFVRSAVEYAPRPGVRVVAGDASDADNLDAAMKEQNAVIDTVGGKTPYRETDLERSVARAIIESMKRNEVRRLIVVSAIGVGDSSDQATFFVEHLLVPTFLRGSTKDKLEMEKVVKAAGLDFVLVRPAILSDNPATGAVRVFEGHDKAHKITRADVAQFLVEQLTSDEHLGRAVTIANS